MSKETGQFAIKFGGLNQATVYCFWKIHSCINFVLSAIQMSLQKPEMYKVEGIFWLRNGPNLFHRIQTFQMVIKDTPFHPVLIFKTISKSLGNFTENAIFRIFIKISFPQTLKCMKVTCKLKSAEKFIQENFMRQNLIFAFFSKKLSMT